MPVMDGYTAINIIKSNDSFRNIPLIAFSASGMKDQKDKMRLIADDFLIKPIYKEVLVAKLMKYLPYEVLENPGRQRYEIPNEVPKKVKSIQSLSTNSKAAMIHLFMPFISKQLNTLNIDELIGLVERIEEYNKDIQNTEISKFCSILSASIQSFNILKITVTLKQLSSFITK